MLTEGTRWHLERCISEGLERLGYPDAWPHDGTGQQGQCSVGKVPHPWTQDLDRLATALAWLRRQSTLWGWQLNTAAAGDEGQSPTYSAIVWAPRLVREQAWGHTPTEALARAAGQMLTSLRRGEGQIHE